VTHTLLGPDHYLPFIVLRPGLLHSHALAGLTLLLCGAAMQFLGL
jgi:hypothetical protein